MLNAPYKTEGAEHQKYSRRGRGASGGMCQRSGALWILLNPLRGVFDIAGSNGGSWRAGAAKQL
jgi:hypothetical protein